MKKYSRVVARINLDAIEYNMDAMNSHTNSDTKMLNVIKADGYGHGAVQIAHMMKDKEYLWGFAVATLDEAVVLRESGITNSILVLGCVFPDQFEDMFKYDISMTVYNKELFEPAAELAKSMNKKLKIHIKLDTGMGRLGFPPNDNSIEEIKEICNMDCVVNEGMFTHFAKADEIDKSYTENQLQKFEYMIKSLKNNDVLFSHYHASNSAGIIDIRDANYDLVRTGISCYGLYPSNEVDHETIRLQPAMELISHIVSLKEFHKGQAISYGGTFVAEHDIKVATIPVGYADGYPRSLSNKGYVLIRGKKARILGRVCMDQFMVDVTEIPETVIFDKVVLVGKSEDETLPVEVLSEISDRFNYEFVCDISKRVPREYIRRNEVISQSDYFKVV
ncbi:MAG: alanine racemase [Suipraeoptans sp.]